MQFYTTLLTDLLVYATATAKVFRHKEWCHVSCRLHVYIFQYAIQYRTKSTIHLAFYHYTLGTLFCQLLNLEFLGHTCHY